MSIVCIYTYNICDISGSQKSIEKFLFQNRKIQNSKLVQFVKSYYVLKMSEILRGKNRDTLLNYEKGKNNLYCKMLHQMRLHGLLVSVLEVLMLKKLCFGRLIIECVDEILQTIEGNRLNELNIHQIFINESPLKRN